MENLFKKKVKEKSTDPIVSNKNLIAENLISKQEIRASKPVGLPTGGKLALPLWLCGAGAVGEPVPTK